MNTRVKTVALFLAIALTLSMTGAAWAGPGDDAAGDDAAGKALAWLATKQNADGGFSDGFSPNSSVSATADVVVSLAAARQDAGAWKKNGVSPLDYLRNRAGQVSKGGELAKVLMAVVATGNNPRGFGGVDLVARLNGLYKSAGYGGTLYEDTLVGLALANAGQTVPADVIARLIQSQTADGAWAFTGDTAAGAGDTNTTALVVQALVAVGKKDATGRALDYFRRTQNADAGWPYQVPSPYGAETDANSTANVLQALFATGQSLGDWSKTGKSDPLGALIWLQDAKTGAFNYQASMPGANLLATVQAIPALEGATFVRLPVTPASVVSSTVAAPPQTLPVAGGPKAGGPKAGGPLPVLPLMMLSLGVVLASAGWLVRRKA